MSEIKIGGKPLEYCRKMARCMPFAPSSREATDAVESTFRDCLDLIEHQAAEIARLRKALEWLADYDGSSVHPDHSFSFKRGAASVLYTTSNKAKEALGLPHPVFGKEALTEKPE